MDDMALARDRERTVTVVSIVVTLIVLVGYIALGNNPVSLRLRGLAGMNDRIRPAVDAGGAGSFAFLYTQRGSDEPVGFSPCRTVHYVVNPEHAPNGWEQLVDTGIAEVSDRTGLDFTDDGTTSDRDFDNRLGRSGNAEPVIIGWADAGEVSGLADDVAGLGGPVMIELAGRRVLVTGSVVMDSDTTDQLDGAVGGKRQQLALLLHELGHLVGLDHVDDRNELMYPRAGARTTYGPGDLAGLAQLGAIPCG
ncbi:hypothetical protein BH11ACT8_BH11ACT8_14580 [soil metagenome]